MRGHTPGPWTIRHGTNIFGERTDVGHVGIIANTGGHSSNKEDCGPESEANAALIAAAPDLLSACEMAEKCLIDLAPYPPEVAEAVIAIAEIAHAAIQKATGSEIFDVGARS